MNEQCCPTESIDNVEIVKTMDLEVVEELSEEQKKIDFLTNKEIRSQERLDVCKQCPELIGPLNNCRQCGCFMNIKVRIYSATCPLGKW